MWLLGCSNGGIPLDGTLLVTDRASGSIAFIDLETRAEVARVPVGEIIPHEVAVSPDGSMALTSEYGPNDQPGQSVILMDVATASTVARIDLGPDSRPHTALFLPDGRHAVATMQDSDQLALIDLEAQAVIRTYATGGREGHMVRLSPDGSRAYVSSRLGDGTLSVIFLNEDRARFGLQTVRLKPSPSSTRNRWKSSRRLTPGAIPDASRWGRTVMPFRPTVAAAEGRYRNTCGCGMSSRGRC